jgi:3-oxoadipate enol-lactonase
MPRMRVNGVELYYEEQGRGPQTVVFAHGLLLDGRMFAGQVDALKDRYRCICFDFRSQGRSEVTPGGYDMDTLTDDVAALVRTLGAWPCHFVGLSMGGFVGMRLAARQPELLCSLSLFDTTAGPERHWLRYRLMRLWTRLFGVRGIVGLVMPVLFGPHFLTAPERAAEREGWRARLSANDRGGSARAIDGVIRRAGVEGELDKIKLPTLVLVGADDRANPPEQSQHMHQKIAGSRLVIVPGAGHSVTIEQPQAVNEALAAFLADVPSPAVGGR